MVSRNNHHNNGHNRNPPPGGLPPPPGYHPPQTIASSRGKRTGIIIALLFIVIVIAVIVVAILTVWDSNGNYIAQDEKGNNSKGNNNDNSNDTTNTNAPTSSPTTTSTIANSEGPTIQRCNGLSNLCDVPVSDVYFATVHNAASTAEDGVTLLPNHQYGLIKALEAGYRGINVDIGKCVDTGVRLIHTKCFIASLDIVSKFTSIMTFLNDNPNEVLLMPIQIENNGEGGIVTLIEIDDVLNNITGFKEQIYIHPSNDAPWPTLRQLIDANTRILFMHYDAIEDCSSGNNSQCPVALQQEWFDVAAETQFEFNTIDNVKNSTYSCELTRGPPISDRNQSPFIGINIFTSIPIIDNCIVLNEKQFLLQHIQECSELYNYQPNVIIIDCWDIGDLLIVVQELNEQL